MFDVLLSLGVQENTTSFPHPFFFHICPNLACHFLPQAWFFHASCRKHLLKLKQLSTHSKWRCLPAPTSHAEGLQSAIRVCLWLSKIWATCFGFSSSKAVLISKLVKNIVGLTTVQCLNTGYLSSCHSQCFCTKFVLVSVGSLLHPLHQHVRFFHFSGFFFFSRSRMRCQRCCSFRIPQIPVSRSSKAHETFLKTPRKSVDLFHGQLFDYFAHDRVFGSVNLVVALFGPGLQHQVYCDFCAASVLCKS